LRRPSGIEVLGGFGGDGLRFALALVNELLDARLDGHQRVARSLEIRCSCGGIFI
jgi:hypothetical protein